MLLAMIPAAGWVILISVGLIIGGLLMMRMAPGAGNPVTVAIVWYAGFGVMALGLLLLLFPVLAFVYANVRAAFAV